MSAKGKNSKGCDCQRNGEWKRKPKGVRLDTANKVLVPIFRANSTRHNKESCRVHFILDLLQPIVVGAPEGLPKVDLMQRRLKTVNF